MKLSPNTKVCGCIFRKARDWSFSLFPLRLQLGSKREMRDKNVAKIKLRVVVKNFLSVHPISAVSPKGKIDPSVSYYKTTPTPLPKVQITESNPR